jgi:hypothetical protein
MNCPEPIAEPVLAIIRHSLLQARMAGWEGDAELCAVLMDHIHNLPDLLSDYSEERLAYYWDTERPVFVDRVPADVSNPYLPLWDDLQQCGNLTEATATDT